ncbi:MAG: hypothetical protein E3J81_02230 [Dehalococcoidia bacterium]|nr:MAG: hypothetical protein E3J81_02230 [Dehalococcoidia bacterium]
MSALSLNRTLPITLSIREGAVVMSATEERGQARIEAQTAISGAYLIQALKALLGMVEVKVGDPKALILFTVDGYRFVVMPVVLPVKAVAEAEAEARAPKQLGLGL